MNTNLHKTILPVLACFILEGCGNTHPEHSAAWLTMGTFAELTASAPKSRIDVYKTITMDQFDLINNTLSIRNPASELSRINALSGTAGIKVSPTTGAILAIAKDYSSRTGGLFDPTVAPVIRLWGFSGAKKPDSVPSADAIASALSHSGYQHLIVSNGIVRLEFKEMMIDLGGIAKGYAVDLAYNALKEKGAENVMINLGGNIRCIGKATAMRGWRVGVRNPFDQNKLLGAVTLPDGMAVATSGNYERYIQIDGKRYAHIIDPRTGKPVRGTAGVTVISPTATEADALSTSFYVAGKEESQKLLSSFPESHILLVPDEQPLRILVSEGFREFYKPPPGTRIELLRSDR